ncbi:MAG: hypothetical protein AB4426_14905 [Xenococcaceae cyanobacterium]
MNSERVKWIHLDEYERKYLREVIQAYDRIMQVTKEAMNQSLEPKLIRALEICQSLVDFKGEPSSLPCQAIELFCEISKEPSVLLNLLKKYSLKTQKAFKTVDEYARNADNWRVKRKKCNLGFGVKDHCTILSFFLNLYSQKFKYFTGNFDSPEKICELLKDWKGIELKVLLQEDSRLLVTD